MGLENVDAWHRRAEQINEKFDFVTSRAVTKLSTFIGWVTNKLEEASRHKISNGILALKGGNLDEELLIPQKVFIQPISDYFEEPFFETKKIVHVDLP